MGRFTKHFTTNTSFTSKTPHQQTTNHHASTMMFRTLTFAAVSIIGTSAMEVQMHGRIPSYPGVPSIFARWNIPEFNLEKSGNQLGNLQIFDGQTYEQQRIAILHNQKNYIQDGYEKIRLMMEQGQRTPNAVDMGEMQKLRGQLHESSAENKSQAQEIIALKSELKKQGLSEPPKVTIPSIIKGYTGATVFYLCGAATVLGVAAGLNWAGWVPWNTDFFTSAKECVLNCN